MNKKGGVTIPIFECIFNGAESIESFDREYDVKLYNALPNLYCICIADNSVKLRRIVAGLFIKTSYTHHDSGFLDAIHAAALASEHLCSFLGDKASFLPARLTIEGSAPPSENEMLQIMMQQFIKHSVGGHA